MTRPFSSSISIKHFVDMRAADLVNAKLADARLYEPLECTFVFVGAPQRLVLVADMSSHEVVKNGSDACRGRRRRPILDRILAAVNALAQIPRLPHGFEG